MTEHGYGRLPEPRFVVMTPGPAQGRILPVQSDHAVIGRGDDCEIVLTDPHVSRRHAALTRSQGHVYLEDLSSQSGTRVNGRPVHAAQALRPGDVVQVATIALRFDDGTGAGPETSVMPPQRTRDDPAQLRTPPPGVNYSIRDQSAWQLNNVAGNQYVNHIQRRDNFLREVAATKTKARYLIWLGLALTVAGFAGWAGNILRFIESIQNIDMSDPTAEPDIQLLGPEVGGIPIAVIAFSAFFVGSLMMMVGIVLHLVAAARKRRVERDYAGLI